MSSMIQAGPAGSRPGGARPRHYFTVDVEEYFQVSALAGVAPRDRWDEYESRVEASTDRLLELLDAHGATGTFFTLGCVASKHPDLVRRIAAAGHEVASHGWDHRKVTDCTPADFRESVRTSKVELEQLAGAPVLGFRAPSFSILPGYEWALDVLIEEGYRYDSSLFPITRPGYGYRGGARDQYTIRRATGELEEFPPATLKALGARLPAAGGAYLRLFPYQLVSSAFRQAERRGSATTFYVHPWELDPDQPRFEVGAATRVRHYGRLGITASRIERLLREFRFCAIAEVLGGEPVRL